MECSVDWPEAHSPTRRPVDEEHGPMGADGLPELAFALCCRLLSLDGRIAPVIGPILPRTPQAYMCQEARAHGVDRPRQPNKGHGGSAQSTQGRHRAGRWTSRVPPRRVTESLGGTPHRDATWWTEGSERAPWGASTKILSTTSGSMHPRRCAPVSAARPPTATAK